MVVVIVKVVMMVVVAQNWEVALDDIYLWNNDVGAKGYDIDSWLKMKLFYPQVPLSGQVRPLN